MLRPPQLALFLALSLSLSAEGTNEGDSRLRFKRVLAACERGLHLVARAGGGREPQYTLLQRNAASDPSLFSVEREKNGRKIATVAAVRIVPENVEQLFLHEYAPGKFGAKGLVAWAPDVDIGISLFWKTGEGNSGIEVHHRDAVAFVAAESAAAQIQSAHGFLSQLEVFAQEIPGADPATKQSVDAISQTIFALSEELETSSARNRAHSAEISAHRKQDAFSASDLNFHLGFQLTADRRRDGSIVIRNLDVDSSLSSAQTTYLFSSEAMAKLSPHQKQMLGSLLSKMILEAHEGISPGLRDYSNIRVKNLDLLRRHQIPIVAPAGLSLTSL